MLPALEEPDMDGRGTSVIHAEALDPSGMVGGTSDVEF